MLKISVATALLVGLITSAWAAPSNPPAQPADSHAYVEPLDAPTLNELKALYKQLIDAENKHDLKAVRPLVWTSPSTLFVAKTATAAEGNWAGFWGNDVVMRHFHDLYQGPVPHRPRLFPGKDRRTYPRCRRNLRTRENHRGLWWPGPCAQAISNDFGVDQDA
jgi:hypothetical protein